MCEPSTNHRPKGQKGIQTMTRVPPSHRVREAIETLLAEGLTDQGDAASGLFRLGAQPVVQELLEQEVTDRLERGHYQRADATQPHRGYRNGYKQRQVHTAEGTVPVCRPPGPGSRRAVRESPVGVPAAGQ